MTAGLSRGAWVVLNMAWKIRSRPQQCEGNHGDAVVTAIGEIAGSDDHPVGEAIPELDV